MPESRLVPCSIHVSVDLEIDSSCCALLTSCTNFLFYSGNSLTFTTSIQNQGLDRGVNDNFHDPKYISSRLKL